MNVHHGEIDLAARFWARVERQSSEQCWPWKGTRNRQGYGRLEILGKAWMGHRLSYVVNVGEIPEGRVIDHKCRNKACVNPAHLEAVTHSVNCRRRDNAVVRVKSYNRKQNQLENFG